MEAKNKVLIKTNKITNIKRCKTLFLFDTGLPNNLFKHKEIDCFENLYSEIQKKFLDNESMLCKLTSVMSTVELIGLGKELGEFLKNYKLNINNEITLQNFNSLVDRLEIKLKKDITPKYIKNKVRQEIELNKHNKIVREFLVNADEAYIKLNINIFFRMLSTSLVLYHPDFSKKINETADKTKVREFLHAIITKQPNQSLAYLIYSFYNQPEVKSKVKKIINLDYIKSTPSKELLDYEVVHFLSRGYCEGTKVIPVIFLTTEKNLKLWVERLSIYRGFLKNMNLDFQNESNIIYYFAKDNIFKKCTVI